MSTIIADNVGLSPANSAAQNSAAWDALMLLIPVQQARPILFRPGTYSFERQLDVIRAVQILGAGGGPNLPATKFAFPAGSHGIYLHSYTTYSGTGTDRSDSAQVRNIWVTASGKTTVKHGIVVRSPAYVAECYVDGFAGDGVNLHASLPAASSSLAAVRRTWSVGNGLTRTVDTSSVDGTTLTVNTSAPHNLAVGDLIWVTRGTTETNPDVQRRVVASVPDADTFTVNLWTTDNNGNPWEEYEPTQIRTGCGFFTAGGDASAILFESCASYQNEAWGNADIGFLGNTHIAELADGNEMGAYFSPLATSPTAWIGCYSEASNPYSFINSPSVVIGGDHGSPVRGSCVGNIWGNYTRMPVLVRDIDGAEAGQVIVGCTPDANPTHLQFLVGGSASPLNCIWDYSSAQLGGWADTFAWFNYAFLGGAGFLVTTPTTTWPNGRTAANANSGRVVFPSGLHLNRGSRWDEGTAAPVDGDWIQGDRRWNQAPAVGDPEYWVCTVSGSPGTWVAGPDL